MDNLLNIPVTPQPIVPQDDESPEKAILLNLKQHLTQVTGIRYVDEDWGQLDDYSPNPPVQWPCVLIDVSAVSYSNLGQDATRIPNSRQQGEAQLTVKIANVKLSNTSVMAPPQGSVILDLMQQVHNRLHGYRPYERAGKLIRVSMQRSRRDDGVQVYEVNYSFALHNV
jgi:hypothetical protein